jgi:hypothetical protein
MYQIVDQFGTILGEYHNRRSAEFALVTEFQYYDKYKTLTIRKNPNLL